MVYLPIEIKDKIILMSYKLLYEDVLSEFKEYINEYDFLFPFKRNILLIESTIVFYEDNEDEDELNEVIFETIEELIILN